jgi:hypothetical protein
MRLQRPASSHAKHETAPLLVQEALSSPGQPLDEGTRAFVEPRLGHDFSKVRVHVDELAAESAKAVNARAYTIGQEVVFDAGEYVPTTHEGRQLLAHELMHVIQQKSAPSNSGTSEPRLSQPEDAAEQEAEANAAIVAKGGTIQLSGQRGTGIQRQQAPKPRGGERARPKSTGQIAAEDVAGIIAEQMQMWYSASRLGIQNAALEGDDEGAKWFLIALGGNLVWAATAFVAPEATVAIRLMSVGGAAVGSGTIERVYKEDLPVDTFRDRAAASLGAAYNALVDNQAALTGALEDLYFKQGLTDRDDARQAEQRRRLGWHFLFRDDIGYANPAALESNAKNDIESIWRNFLPCWRILYLPITPRYIEQDRSKYTLVCYYRALVSSGVADRSQGVRKTGIYRMVGGRAGQINVEAAGDVYEFPGGATVTKTPGPQDFWWGNITAQVP